jgi:hypothetical protein
MKKNRQKTTGLIVIGTVQDRTRRMVPADNPTTEIVTYLVTDESEKRYYIDDYRPSEYYEIGEFIEVPIYVKPYRKRNGELSYSLNIQKAYQYQTKGESF